MNSTLLQLMINVIGRVNLGGGVLEVTVYEFADLLIADPMQLLILVPRFSGQRIGMSCNLLQSVD